MTEHLIDKLLSAGMTEYNVFDIDARDFYERYFSVKFTPIRVRIPYKSGHNDPYYIASSNGQDEVILHQSYPINDGDNNFYLLKGDTRISIQRICHLMGLELLTDMGYMPPIESNSLPNYKSRNLRIKAKVIEIIAGIIYNKTPFKESQIEIRYDSDQVEVSRIFTISDIEIMSSIRVVKYFISNNDADIRAIQKSSSYINQIQDWMISLQLYNESKSDFEEIAYIDIWEDRDISYGYIVESVEFNNPDEIDSGFDFSDKKLIEMGLL